MGCYKDNSTRAVPLQLGNASAAMTVPMCAARAQAAGLLVFAVQGGNLVGTRVKKQQAKLWCHKPGSVGMSGAGTCVVEVCVPVV